MSNNYNGLSFNQEEIDKFKKGVNNCYTYAINQPINPFTNTIYDSWVKCQPGNLGGMGIDKGNLVRASKKSIVLARKDLKKLGYELLKTTYKKQIKSNEECWKVAFCYTNNDYHWYRQNLDGTWSHKRGLYGKVLNVDEDKNIIYNPEICNRGDYVNFVGFYIIKKKEQVA
jgi:hypothetical protein